MIEEGEVFKLEKGNRAVVRFARKTACENCNMCFKPKSEQYAEITLKNTLNAKEGDRVTVRMGKRAVLSASIIVYLMPVLFVGILLAVTYKLDPVLSFVFAMVGLVIAETAIALTDRMLRKKTEYMPMMVEVILGEPTQNNTDSAESVTENADITETVTDQADAVEAATDNTIEKSELLNKALFNMNEQVRIDENTDLDGKSE